MRSKWIPSFVPPPGWLPRRERAKQSLQRDRAGSGSNGAFEVFVEMLVYWLQVAFLILAIVWLLGHL